MKRRLRVDHIGPGMFSNELTVSFEAGDQHYDLLAPRRYVDEARKEMEVEVIADRGDHLIVDLPRETFTSGNRIQVPADRLVPLVAAAA